MPDDAHLLKLGTYAFSVSTAAYGELSRLQEYLDLRGTIYPAWRGGLGQLDAMRAEAAKGEPLRLVGGDGKVLGLWVITRIRETGSAHLAGGVPRKVEFQISLAFYGEDGEG